MDYLFEYQHYSYYKCNDCDTVSTHPIPSKDVIENHYSKKFQGGNYSLIREYSTQYMRVYNGFCDLIEKKLASKGQNLNGKKVLDIGCFTGEFLQVIDSKGGDVFGLELQPDAVEIANSKFPGRIFKADVFSNDFPTIKYDIITMFGLIEHVVDPIRLLKQANELLNPGGLIVIQTPDSSSMIARIMGKFWFCYAPIEHIHIFSRKSIIHILSNMDNQNIEIKQHWKILPIAYVFNQFQNFGPEFEKMLKPLKFILNKLKIPLPFYGGEMIVTAFKQE
jgi:2-polyprenyl-3-methyl-5-hydroxy-6-metoxy-1,4-benzoquinol methylase